MTAEQAGGHRRPDQRVVLPLVEQVDGDRQRIAATGERGTDDDVVDDPDPPGVAAIEVGDRPHPLGETLHQKAESDQRDHPQHHKGDGNQTPLQWLIVTHCSPPSSGSSSLLRFTTHVNPASAIAGSAM